MTAKSDRLQAVMGIRADMARLLLFLMTAALWGSSFYFTKIALHTFTPIGIVALRMTGGAVVLGIAVAKTNAAVPTGARAWAKVFALSLVGFTLPYLLLTWGQMYVTSVLASILGATTPLWVLVLAAFLRREFLTRRKFVGSIFGFTGMLWLILASQGGPGPLESPTVGALAVAGSSVLFAVGNIASRWLVIRFQPLATAFAQVVLAAIVTLPVGLVQGIAHANLRLDSVVAVIWLGVIGSGLCYAMWFYLISAWGSVRTASNTFLQPLVGTTLGVSFLAEPLTIAMVFGAVLTLAGVFALAMPTPANAGKGAANFETSID